MLKRPTPPPVAAVLPLKAELVTVIAVVAMAATFGAATRAAFTAIVFVFELTRDYDVLRKNYEQLVTRRESASMSGDVDNLSRMAEFRIIEPPRISPKPVFPNRLALVPLVLVLAIAAGMATALAISQILPTFFNARQVRSATKRPVLGAVSLQFTQPVVHRRKQANVAFAGGVGVLIALYGSWITWVALAARG